jgi:hypothetical protein
MATAKTNLFIYVIYLDLKYKLFMDEVELVAAAEAAANAPLRDDDAHNDGDNDVKDDASCAEPLYRAMAWWPPMYRCTQGQ